MESMQEFKEALLAKTPDDSRYREVVSGIRIFDNGREEIYYIAYCKTRDGQQSGSIEYSTPESALADLIHQMYPETEEVQTDIKI
jgi:hypothetical protein